MAENPMIELAQTVMLEQYGLDEHEWELFKFSEGAKRVTIGMRDHERGIPLTASFPITFLEIESMKKWEYAKKEIYIKNLVASEEDLHPGLSEDHEFRNLYVKLAMGEMTEEMTLEEVGLKEPEAVEKPEAEPEEELDKQLELDVTEEEETPPKKTKSLKKTKGIKKVKSK